MVICPAGCHVIIFYPFSVQGNFIDTKRRGVKAGRWHFLVRRKFPEEYRTSHLLRREIMRNHLGLQISGIKNTCCKSCFCFCSISIIVPDFERNLILLFSGKRLSGIRNQHRLITLNLSTVPEAFFCTAHNQMPCCLHHIVVTWCDLPWKAGNLHSQSFGLFPVFYPEIINFHSCLLLPASTFT